MRASVGRSTSNPEGTGCTGPPYEASCLVKTGYLENFTYAQHIVQNYSSRTSPPSLSTSPIWPTALCPSWRRSNPHPTPGSTNTDPTLTPIQKMSRRSRGMYSTIINGLMESYFVERFGVYLYLRRERRHVRSCLAAARRQSRWHPAAGPASTDSVCYTVKGPTCNFVWTGYRIPLIVVSPFAKKNYVSHTRCGFDGHPEVHRNPVQSTRPQRAGCGSDRYDRVLRLQQSAVGDSADAANQNLSNPCYLNKLP